jgi:hypothetical protein
MIDPLWRKVLTWGAVGIFLTLPLFLFGFHLWSLGEGERLKVEEFRYIGIFYTTITTLVFALAGLNSWDKRNGKDRHE